jgi:hypothetical protein
MVVFGKMPKVLKRLSKLVMVASLVCLVGGHWALLQSVAWTGMVIRYSQDGTVTEAVAKTFDGHHPCGLCKEIARGKKSEKKAEYGVKLGKLKFCYAPVVFLFKRPSAFWRIASRSEVAEPLTYAPPVPPPRSQVV